MVNHCLAPGAQHQHEQTETQCAHCVLPSYVGRLYDDPIAEGPDPDSLATLDAAHERVDYPIQFVGSENRSRTHS